MTAQEYNRLWAGDWVPAVPDTQPPAADMPPLPLMVLDALADDIESIHTMRLRGEMAPSGIDLVGEAHLCDALRSLLADGLVEVEYEYVGVGDRIARRWPVPEPATADSDLQRYWFRMTAAGRKAWEAGEAELVAYWDANPLTPADGTHQTPR
jgi:hypothetical protein